MYVFSCFQETMRELINYLEELPANEKVLTSEPPMVKYLYALGIKKGRPSQADQVCTLS